MKTEISLLSDTVKNPIITKEQIKLHVKNSLRGLSIGEAIDLIAEVKHELLKETRIN
jgi:hypothetical protein